MEREKGKKWNQISFCFYTAMWADKAHVHDFHQLLKKAALILGAI